jgi:hypothetical protein
VKAIRARWPRVEILIRGDSHYARHEAMTWCERNRIGYVFGLAGNPVLLTRIAALAEDAAVSRVQRENDKVRRFGEFRYAAKSWKVARRVIGRVEASPQGSDSRFIVTNLAGTPRWLYESVYCQRGQAENLMYGRLPPCKQVSSSFRHAWSAAAMYPASLGYTPAGLDEFRELAPDYQGELEALRFSRALPTPVRPACHRVKEHPRSLWRSRQSRFTQASIRPPRDRLRRGSALPRPSGRAYWPPPLPPR